jgi:lipooligosaccharide transport system permease protein
MNGNNIPSLSARILSVWYRHYLVYTRSLISNGLPPFLEPLIFLAGVGLGLGKYIVNTVEGMTYIDFLASGLLVTSSMYTASFECTFGTFIRLEYEKAYDGMLSAPITANNLIIGEIFWAGTKGLFFSLAVLIIISVFGVIPLGWSLLSPAVGFLAGLMFATISLWVTSFVKNINHFNFYMTGVLSPMFFFSGVVFPLSDLPKALQPVAEIMPLTHAVRLVRALCNHSFQIVLFWDMLYIILVILIMGYFATRRLKRLLIL